MNIIFASDFAQLPPVRSTSLYDGKVGTQASSSMSLYEQECAIGKALWHQITTVVILRQNMRQKTQTEEDAQFRTALENMRYRSCTDKDIRFLRTLINNDKNKLSDKRFIDVPIIVRYNVHRDVINREGARMYASRNGLPLTTFFSIDKIAPQDNPKEGRTRGRKKQSALQHLNKVLQNIVWNLTPCSTGNVAGKLDLCTGMPVIIKKNIATECCITNGACGVVYGWHSYTIAPGKESLDVVFVKLIDPPKSIQLDGLPENVVPIPKQTVTVQCLLPNDNIINVVRQQVPLLLNFALTDYGSQGKTRKTNACYLVDASDRKSVV